MPSPAISIDHVSKVYPNGFQALENVSLTFYPKEIHALLGENGAGKSTLMNIIYGVHEPTSGGLLIGNRQVIHRKPADAIQNRIGMVHQHFQLVMPFSIAENLALVARGNRKSLFKRTESVREFMLGYGVDIAPDSVVANLPLALQQRVEILKALVNDTRILLLDEPSTILTPTEVHALYVTVRKIAEKGTAVAVVTHNVDEVLANADRYTILRRGRMNGSGLTRECQAEELVEKIVGRSVSIVSRIGEERVAGAERMRVKGVSFSARSGSPGLNDIHFALHEKEVVGIAGVEGNGQTELFELLAGQRKPDAGNTEGSRQKVALVPQDRHHEGLSLDMPVSHNLLYTEIMRGKYRRFGLLDHKAIAEKANAMIGQADIRTQSHAALARSLSGGNQQKIVLARALAEGAPIIVAYQPTRGLDVAAAESVLIRLAQAADMGTTVVIISSNIEELIRVSDRIMVMNGGRITGEVSGDAMTIEKIGPLMTRSERAGMKSREESCLTH